MKLVVGQRLYKFNEAGGMGVVTDTTYINCYWPRLESPTEIFEKGSTNIQVMGSTIPRYVIFPEDTEFVDYSPDALNEALNRAIIVGNQYNAEKFEIAYIEAISRLLPTETLFKTSDGTSPGVIEEIVESIAEKTSTLYTKTLNWFASLFGGP